MAHGQSQRVERHLRRMKALERLNVCFSKVTPGCAATPRITG